MVTPILVHINYQILDAKPADLESHVEANLAIAPYVYFALLGAALGFGLFAILAKPRRKLVLIVGIAGLLISTYSLLSFSTYMLSLLSV